jgi:AraC-like DNA-binding protein
MRISSRKPQTSQEAEGFDWLAPFQVPPAGRPEVSAAKKEAVLSIARGLLEARADAHWSAWASAYCQLLLLTLTGNVPANPSRRIVDVEPFSSILPGLRAMMDSHGTIRESEAAQASGLSLSAFSRSFNRVTGSGFASFSLRLKLKRAAHLLASTALPIKEISGTSSFCDLSHFYRSFRECFRVSPGEYRQGLRSRPDAQSHGT